MSRGWNGVTNWSLLWSSLAKGFFMVNSNHMAPYRTEPVFTVIQHRFLKLVYQHDSCFYKASGYVQNPIFDQKWLDNRHENVSFWTLTNLSPCMTIQILFLKRFFIACYIFNYRSLPSRFDFMMKHRACIIWYKLTCMVMKLHLGLKAFI